MTERFDDDRKGTNSETLLINLKEPGKIMSKRNAGMHDTKMCPVLNVKVYGQDMEIYEWLRNVTAYLFICIHSFICDPFQMQRLKYRAGNLPRPFHTIFCSNVACGDRG